MNEYKTNAIKQVEGEVMVGAGKREADIYFKYLLFLSDQLAVSFSFSIQKANNIPVCLQTPTILHLGAHIPLTIWLALLGPH